MDIRAIPICILLQVCVNIFCIYVYIYVPRASVYLPESPGMCLKLASSVKQAKYCSTGARDMKKSNA